MGALIVIITLGFGFSIWLQTHIQSLVVTEKNTAAPRGELARLEIIDEIAEPQAIAAELLQKISQSPSPGTTLSESIVSKLALDDKREELVYTTMAITPNDPIATQWYTNQIQAPLGWEQSTGSADVTIAIIDTGFALAHEDLIDAWWQNSGETGTTTSLDTCWNGAPQDKRTNNCDDDQNGYVDDWRGWDFSNNDNTPQAGENDPAGSSHGTRSAGLAGARGNNGRGVASVNWQSRLMPLQALFDDGYGFSSDIAGAIVYAVDNGADVINLSLGGPTADSTIHAAIRYAASNNVIVVAAAGNCGDGNDTYCASFTGAGRMAYPALYSDVISVGATDQNDVRASFSSFGPLLDLVAPGSGTIATTTWSLTNQTTGIST